MSKKRKHTKKVKNMTIQIYNKQHEQEMKEMQEYIDSFKKMNKEQACAKAKASLIRSGVMGKNGSMKKRICK